MIGDAGAGGSRRFARGAKRLPATLAVALGVAALFGTAATASSWQVSSLGLDGTLFGMSCPSTSLCVAVGSGGTVATSTTPAAGAGAWKVVRLPEANGLKGNLRSVSCPSAGFCAAVDFSGGVLTSTEPTGGPESWAQTPLPQAASFYSISCPSLTLCVAVGMHGRILTSTDPSGGASAWSLTELSEPLGLHGVSCVAAPLCVVSDFSGSHVITSTDPTGGAGSWNVATQAFFAGTSAMIGVTCASPALCLMGDAGNLAVSTNPTGGIPAWPVTPLASRFQVLAASCAKPTLCVITTDNGEVGVSTNPTGGSSAWPMTQLIPGTSNGLYGVSCPSESLCVAGGKSGQLAISTNPAETRSPPPAPATKLFGHHRRVRRVRRGKTTAGIRFHFKAIGLVSEFRCRLDRGPYRRCHSPKGYRLRPGDHVFRVRAIGPGGADPTPATSRVKVLK